MLFWLKIDQGGDAVTRKELVKLRSVCVSDCDVSALSDLRFVSVNSSLSLSEKTQSFFSQIKNPYLFKVGDVVMKIEHGGTVDFSDAIVNIISKNYH